MVLSDLLADMILSLACWWRSASCRGHLVGRLFTGGLRFPDQLVVLLQALACSLPCKDTDHLQETRSTVNLVGRRHRPRPSVLAGGRGNEQCACHIAEAAATSVVVETYTSTRPTPVTEARLQVGILCSSYYWLPRRGDWSPQAGD